MAKVIGIKKRIHKYCGGEIEVIELRESFRHLVRCKKCGETWKTPIEILQ